MVDAATLRFSRALRFYSLFDLGRFPGSSLLARSKRGRLSFTLLFTGVLRQLAARDFWGKTWLVAIVAFLFARSSGSMGPGRFSTDLLLLSRRLLQSVLGRPTRMRSGRTTQRISGGELFSADHAEHSSILPLYRFAVHPGARTRRLEGDVVQR